MKSQPASKVKMGVGRIWVKDKKEAEMGERTQDRLLEAAKYVNGDSDVAGRREHIKVSSEVDRHLASHLLRQRSRDYANTVPTPLRMWRSRGENGRTEQAQAPTMLLQMYKAGRDKIR